MKRKRTGRKQAATQHKATAVTRAKVEDWLAAIPALIHRQKYELAIKLLRE